MRLFHQRKYRILRRRYWRKLSTKPKAVRLSPRSILKQLLSISGRGTYLNHNVVLTFLKLSQLRHHSNSTCLNLARLAYDHALPPYIKTRGKRHDTRFWIFLWLVEKQYLWFAVFWLADETSGQKLSQITEWCRRNEFLRGRVFCCVSWNPDEFQL